MRAQFQPPFGGFDTSLPWIFRIIPNIFFRIHPYIFSRILPYIFSRFLPYTYFPYMGILYRIGDHRSLVRDDQRFHVSAGCPNEAIKVRTKSTQMNSVFDTNGRITSCERTCEFSEDPGAWACETSCAPAPLIRMTEPTLTVQLC